MHIHPPNDDKGQKVSVQLADLDEVFQRQPPNDSKYIVQGDTTRRSFPVTFVIGEKKEVEIQAGAYWIHIDKDKLRDGLHSFGVNTNW